MSKQLINVFPDYCSTGLWVPGSNELGLNVPGMYSIEASDLGVSPGLQIALKYWHWIWEDAIGDAGESSTWKPRMSKEYIQKWKDDGIMLAHLMSAESEKFIFQFKP